MYENKLDIVKKDFVKYLASLGISSKSLRNYKSDLSHFPSWIIAKIRSMGAYVESLSDTIPFLSNELANEYKNYMHQDNVPVKTINRRLSTLRHFGRSLTVSQLVDIDFASNLENISLSKPKKTNLTPIVSEFGTYLEAKNVSKNTIKNYLSDTRQFLSWLEDNQHLINKNN